LFVLVGIDGIESRENHGLDFLIARKRFFGRSSCFGNRIADLDVSHSLNGSGKKTNFADAQLINRCWSRAIHSQSFYLVIAPGVKEANLHSGPDGAVNNAKENDHAAVGVVPRVE